jgi:hypothetical protein
MQEFQDLWEAAMDKFAEPEQSAPVKNLKAESYASEQEDARGLYGIDDDTAYWRVMASLEKGVDSPDILEMIQEVRKDLTANPVPRSTLGKDQTLVVTPDWTDGDDLNKLIKMKQELHDLGDKLAALGVTKESEQKVITYGEEKVDSIWSSIKSLRAKIDDLSDNLPPSGLRDAQS